MKAVDIKFPGIFNSTPRLEIPLFQRPYVWKELENWLPLWQDIRRASEQVEAEQSGQATHSDPATYFLGAVVLQERPFRPKRIRSSFIIDGQQRLTTMQAFLAAARAVADACGATDIAAKFQDYVENPPKHVNDEHPEDRYRVWPLPQDRKALEWAVRAPGDTTVMPTKDSTIGRARHWFEVELKAWLGEVSDAEARLGALQYAIDDRLQFVQIVLEKSDDPQVIFEALNHRGVPLDATDLVKNVLFQTVEQQGHASADALLMEEWLPLDSDVWRTAITTGRIKRPQVDLLLSYFLTVTTGEEVLIEHLFNDFKEWLLKNEINAADAIRDIRRHADSYMALRAVSLTTPAGRLIDMMDATQTNTPWPVLLFLHVSDAPQGQLDLAANAIASYLMRRNVCGLTTKDYNRLFLHILNLCRNSPISHAGQAVVNGLESQQADSRYWPGDAEFEQALTDHGLYKRVVRARLKSLLVGLENYLRSSKSEYTQPLSVRDSTLNIEHVLPQKWEKHWTPAGASDAQMELRRLAVHKLGNLTVTTTKMNPSLSNKPWSEKRKEVQKHSLVTLTTASILSPPPCTQMSMDTWVSHWDEARIAVRGEWLASQAAAAWPRFGWQHVPSKPEQPSTDIEGEKGLDE